MSPLLHTEDLSGCAHETDAPRPPARPIEGEAEQNTDVPTPRRTIRVVRNGQYLGTLLG